MSRREIFQGRDCWLGRMVPRHLSLVSCLLVLGLLLPHRCAAVTLQTTAVHAMAGPFDNVLGSSFYNLHVWSSYLTGFEGGDDINYERRSYFTFDLSEVTETITSASFVIWSPPPLPANNFSGGFRSDRLEETFELHEVVTPAATIEAIPFSVASTPGVEEVWVDLGDGPVFGSVVMTEADEPAGGKDIVITLNAAAIESLNNATGKWTMGGILNPLPSREADFDADVDVDEIDLAIWESGFGSDDTGDADEDDDTDGADFLAWQRGLSPGFEVGNWQLFGGAAPYYEDPDLAAPFPTLELTTSPAAGIAVPEPTAALLLGLAILVLPATLRYR